ncbi:MAG: hypothetical protein HY722_10855 [Planctomycetes bacterium]|nr:hypothetical protein [Planctomycetota bacterium]
MARYIRIDRDTGEIQLTLPREAEEYRGELYTALQEEFMFDGLDAASEERIDAFVAGWLREHGIDPGAGAALGGAAGPPGPGPLADDGPATSRPPAGGRDRQPFG